ncbi:MAG: DHH family phosphoesterase [Anaerolineae bacterium]|nr:DHH family phosphoesterase [Anaerolineae bacterium]
MSLASAEHRRAVAAIAQAVAGAERVVVASHAYPDADAVGSLLALTLALQARGKTVTPCLPTRMEDAVRNLPGAAQVRVGGAPGIPTPDVVFVLDCSALARIDPLPRRHPEWFEGRPLVNIDHHGSNEAFGAINLVDPGAVSTASILYELLPALDVALTPEVAQCLLTGVLGDSQVFTTPSTDAAALKVAAALVSAGASYPDAVRAVHALALARVRYWGRCSTAWSCCAAGAWRC